MSSGEENGSQSPTMEFIEEPQPQKQHSVSTPLTSNIPSNPPASPPQALIALNSPPTPPAVPQPPSAINSPLQAHSTFTSPRPQIFANYQEYDNDRYFNSLPPGYRFSPHDHELVVHYLDKKVKGLPLPKNRIIDVELYQSDPEFLAARHSHHGEKVWYFFTPRDKKYRNGTRPNRAAGGGFWKATGADKQITYEKPVVGAGNTITYQKTLVGYRKALVYYNGKAPKGDKTNWIMHEFRVNDPPPPQVRNHEDGMRLDDWVLCRIYKKHENRTNVRNRRSNEENSSLTIGDIDEDFMNHHDHNPNDLAAIEAAYAWQIYDLVTNSAFSQQQTDLSGFSDDTNFYALQDSQIPFLAETIGTPDPIVSVNPDDWSDPLVSVNPDDGSDPLVSVNPDDWSDPLVSVNPDDGSDPLVSVNPDDWSSSQRVTGYQDEFVNLTNCSQFNIPDQFFDRYSGKPTNLPMNPSPLANLCPMNTAPPTGHLPPTNTAPIRNLPPPFHWPPSSHKNCSTYWPFPPTNPANSQPTSELMNAAAIHPEQPPQHQ